MQILPIRLIVWYSIGLSAIRSRHHDGQGGMSSVLMVCSGNYIRDNQVEWIWTFVKCILYLPLCSDPRPKAPMAAAKDNILLQPLCCHLADFVRHVHSCLRPYGLNNMLEEQRGLPP